MSGSEKQSQDAMKREMDSTYSNDIRDLAYKKEEKSLVINGFSKRNSEQMELLNDSKLD
uniref:Uncharacterized protein n=1 Tax=Amphimedon queenslandica TaxID=400682 RepID=A0A1X7U071_AMPQE